MSVIFIIETETDFNNKMVISGQPLTNKLCNMLVQQRMTIKPVHGHYALTVFT